MEKAIIFFLTFRHFVLKQYIELNNRKKEEAMELTKEVFQIDAELYSRKLEAFIREKQTQLRRDGIVVAISGGLDSSTVAALCTRAVGPEHVTGLLLPEKDGNPEAVTYAEAVAARLGIHRVIIDISGILKALGTYDFITKYFPTEGIKNAIAKSFIGKRGIGILNTTARGIERSIIRHGTASINSKHRTRMVVTYKFAEERNLLVAGNAHKSEDLVGLFVKYGVDDNADVMPLKNLFRSHILQLAAYVGVPEEIIGRPPNPDIIPGVEDKYMDILGIPSATLDLILYGREQHLPVNEIAGQLAIPQEKVESIFTLVDVTRHMRHHSMAPEF
jgi:NAD+ synthase